MRTVLTSLLLTLTLSVSAKETLPWVHDDYKKAVARAAKEGKPIFVEAWAPW
jgi:hypothetical protein